MSEKLHELPRKCRNCEQVMNLTAKQLRVHAKVCKSGRIIVVAPVVLGPDGQRVK